MYFIRDDLRTPTEYQLSFTFYVSDVQLVLLVLSPQTWEEKQPSKA